MAATGALPFGTTFKIHVTWLRELPNLKPAFDEALSAFLTLGTLGLRATRGLGAFRCDEATDWLKVISTLETKSFTIRRRTNPSDFGDYSSALKDWLLGCVTGCVRSTRRSGPLLSAVANHAKQAPSISARFGSARIGSHGWPLSRLQAGCLEPNPAEIPRCWRITIFQARRLHRSRDPAAIDLLLPDAIENQEV